MVRTNVDQRGNNKIQKRDWEQKGKMKEFTDKRRHTASSNIKVGDLALAKQQRKSSLTSLYIPASYGRYWRQIKGDMVIAKPETTHIVKCLRMANVADK